MRGVQSPSLVNPYEQPMYSIHTDSVIIEDYKWWRSLGIIAQEALRRAKQTARIHHTLP